MSSIKNLLAHIQGRPAMYLGKRSILCLKAFIDGWYLRSPETVEDSDTMSAFQKWIEKKYNIQSSQSWDRIILFYSQDEYDALEIFLKSSAYSWKKPNEEVTMMFRANPSYPARGHTTGQRSQSFWPTSRSKNSGGNG
jgi:hypothetical protein